MSDGVELGAPSVSPPDASPGSGSGSGSGAASPSRQTWGRALQLPPGSPVSADRPGGRCGRSVAAAARVRAGRAGVAACPQEKQSRSKQDILLCVKPELSLVSVVATQTRNYVDISILFK